MMTTSALFNETYEIKSIIGKGGMSTVYLAEHKRLHTRWAVKEVIKSQGMKFDFLAESNLLKRLQHPMLPRIVDIFEDETHIYIVEDFVEGITLEELLRRQGKVDEELGLNWFKDLCSVLDYLHQQQPHPIIYRDMKPSNVMLQPDGKLKLIDFGIAREYKQDSSADTTYIGTKGYAAPEQFGKAQTDARTDIYSLGVTMYHLLTGKSPYEPPYQFVPARQLAPRLSHGMEYILNKCIQPEPDSRYQDVRALLDDLDHIYRYDKAYRKYQMIRRARVLVIACLMCASVGLMAGGRMIMAQEKEQRYLDLLTEANNLYLTAPEQALDVLELAQSLYPDREESYREYTYALYLTGDYQACITYGENCPFPQDGQILLTVASACFELGDYEKAAQDFYAGAQSFEMNADHLRDYAVCLGRIGDVDKAEEILDQLTGLGAAPDVTAYVQGEVAYVKGDYVQAETYFQSALAQTSDNSLIRRCCLSLAETYRDGAGQIADSYTKGIDFINSALARPQLQGNTVLYEMLGAAYYNRGTLERNNDREDLTHAAECFQQVISLGVQREYLYTNAFTAWQAIGEYSKAEDVLDQMEAAYPQLYTPHALRAMLWIMEENGKDQLQRNYRPAYEQYELALKKVTSEDETSLLQQLESLIQQLESGGWL